MSGVYSVEDLLNLRASPLVCKPSSLPPIEEWMGSQESAKRPNTRGRQEDGTSHSEGTQKRPALDPSHRKSTTDPERLVLGPPRRSFASSSGRPFGKFGTLDSEDAQKERAVHHERHKLGEDSDNRFGERRAGALNGRFAARHDQDDTSNERARKRQEDDEPEGKPRRDQDRTRWGARDGREDRALEDNADETGNPKAGARRDQGRSRLEQPWFRGERGGDEIRRDNDRGSSYRRDRGRDGDWDMPGKNDADPEWMGSIEGAEPVQAHTQEDFQRWKERMKAGSGVTEPKAEPVPTITEDITPASENKTQPIPLSGLISPDISANSMDKFFARFNEKKTATDDKTAAKPAAKTRFASIFGPQPEAKPEPSSPAAAAVQAPLHHLLPPPPPPPPLASPEPVSVQHPQLSQPSGHVDADQAGFQRILQMLGKRETGSAQGTNASKSATSLLQNTSHSHQRNASPDLMALFKQEPTRPTPIPPSSASAGYERLIDSRSPTEGQGRQMHTPNKDELLLNLLRQAEISAKPPQMPPQYNDQRGPPGLFGMADGIRNSARPQMTEMQQRDTGRSMFDDPAVSGMPYHDEVRQREPPHRRPTNGTGNGFEDAYMDSLRPSMQYQKAMSSQQNLPPGLQRPPGLDQSMRAPPGWNQPPNQPPSRSAAPPGLSRGMPPGFPGSQQPPMPPILQSIPGQGPQRTPQRKYTGDSAIPNFPPGMGPPPGFMTGGPPPGFHHGSIAGSTQGYGRYAMGGNEQPPQPPQQQQQPPINMQRAFMDMYGNGDRNGQRASNNGLPLPPGFR